MTRKDYELIADTIRRFAWATQVVERSSGPLPLEVVAQSLIGEFAIALKGTNAKFDEKRFVEACSRQTFAQDGESEKA